MPEYIEREALIETFRKIEKDKTDCFNPFANLLIDFIKLVPLTEDVVEVVRCKDCGSYNKHYSECTLNGAHLGENGFCSQGKRKEVNNA